MARIFCVKIAYVWNAALTVRAGISEHRVAAGRCEFFGRQIFRSRSRHQPENGPIVFNRQMVRFRPKDLMTEK
jgi:hypothetical protein